jgi:hypothetical protein
MGQDDTGVFVLLRSSSSGTLSDARKVYQSNWNIDTMDGNGPSGILLDITKTQIFVISKQWLGVGRVACGLDINGKLYHIHEFLNANIQTTTYMTSANLPLRYEIVDGANSVIRQTYQYFRYRPGKSQQIFMTFNMLAKTTEQLLQICASVITETSNDSEAYYEHSVNTGLTAAQVSTTRLPIIGIRPKHTFNSIVNHGQIISVLADYMDVVEIRTSDVVAKYLYHWSDVDYQQQQIDEIAKRRHHEVD